MNEIEPESNAHAAERPIQAVRGTRDRLVQEHALMRQLEVRLTSRFEAAGYESMRIPVLELTDLHERKSGAGIVSKLFAVDDGTVDSVCLRPELTAGIVRAFTVAEPPPALPWRVSCAGPVFRRERSLGDGVYREFTQVGVELIGASGPRADAELIWLADSSLGRLDVRGARIRIGHVGLILEMMARSGLPEAARASLVEMLSEDAAEGRGVGAIERGINQLAAWLGTADGDATPPQVDDGDDEALDRLFRTLVPNIYGRRTGHEILGRLRRKWELGRTLTGALEDVRTQVHAIASLKGPIVDVLDRLAREFGALAPASIAGLRELARALADYDVDLDRVELDLGFGRGIGFYSQMIFELIVDSTQGPVVVCGGGRYDGLARVFGSDRDERGAGFAFGLERLGELIAAADRTGSYAVVASSTRLAPASTEHEANAIRLATILRDLDLKVVLDSPARDEAELARRIEANDAPLYVVVGADPRDCAERLTLHERDGGRVRDVSRAELCRVMRLRIEQPEEATR